MTDPVVIAGLRELAERGTPRGADRIHDGARHASSFDPGGHGDGPGRRRATRPLVAAAAVLAALVGGALVATRSRPAPVPLEVGGTTAGTSITGTSAPAEVTATTTGPSVPAVDLHGRLLGRRLRGTVTRQGVPRPFPAGDSIELRFDDELYVDASCSQGHLGWTIDGDRLVTVPGDGMPTARDCPYMDYAR